MRKSIGIIFGYVLTYGREVSTTLPRIRIPPIIGVPDFFRCDFGPSSRSVCPTCSFFKKGMTNGPAIILMTNAIITGIATQLYGIMFFNPFAWCFLSLLTDRANCIGNYVCPPLCCSLSSSIPLISRYGRIFSKSCLMTGAAICPP